VIAQDEGSFGMTRASNLGVTMAEYGPATYGDRIAAFYDRFVEPTVGATTAAAVEFLAPLATGGHALELGIGTGRIALPLADRGVDVHGIDASTAMLERLKSKPGGAEVPVTIGDFATLEQVDGQFDLIYVVFNTFFALLDQELQITCFQSVAKHLTVDGAFVIEAFVPDPARFDRGQRVGATRVETDRLQLDVSRLDPVSQRVTSQHVLIGAEGIVLLPVQLRYAWPSELDLMARLAGLRLRDRFGGWRREPFTSASPGHVSVYTSA
jgi:SAM-dependent methyltransferase